jgi:two-component system OmpR family sensor kinase
VKSIRARLVLWLVGGCAAGIALVIVATYTFVRSELRDAFDGELQQIARAVDLREDWVEAGRVRIAREGVLFAVRAYDRAGRAYFETALPSMPASVPQSSEPGFTYADTEDGRWRIYTHVSAQGVVQVGQPVEARAALARQLSLRVLIPLLVFLPLLCLLILWLLRPGLAALHETSRLVSDRDAARLDPLPTGGVPSELLPLVRQINALIERLAASLSAQRRFLADAAHGLRSPIAAIALQAQLAARARDRGALAAAHEELLSGTQRAARLVQQLLDFARLEPGASTEAPRPLDIAALIREVIVMHAVQAEERNVDLGADTPRELLLRGRESELRLLLANLVDNALRYAPAYSAVTVAAQEQGGAIEIQVVDEGPGVPAAERERVFERFYRVEGDPTRGTGLGLAIAKAIVEGHGGSIALGEAKPGTGSPGLVVRIRLPVGDVLKSPLSAAAARLESAARRATWHSSVVG